VGGRRGKSAFSPFVPPRPPHPPPQMAVVAPMNKSLSSAILDWALTSGPGAVGFKERGYDLGETVTQRGAADEARMPPDRPIAAFRSGSAWAAELMDIFAGTENTPGGAQHGVKAPKEESERR